MALARSRAGLPDDAPLRPAVRIGPLARLGRPRNSADPRAALTAGLTAGLPRFDDLSGVLAPDVLQLTMPSLRLR